VPYHAILLVLTLLPIVLLSKKLALMIDFGLDTFNLPLALGGVLVAIIVLTPEGLAALHAAAANQLQRSVNICLGSALATISLTVPAVVGIALATGTHMELGLDGTEMVLLVLTLVLSILTFGATRTSMLQGAVHLVVFFIYFALIFDP
jgi:Ca2+:H+ antiporter